MDEVLCLSWGVRSASVTLTIVEVAACVEEEGVVVAAAEDPLPCSVATDAASLPRRFLSLVTVMTDLESMSCQKLLTLRR